MRQETGAAKVIPFPGQMRSGPVAPATSGTLAYATISMENAAASAHRHLTACNTHIEGLRGGTHTWAGLAEELRAASAQMRAALDELSQLPHVAQDLLRTGKR
jgi:hypothetical protein